MQRRSFLKGAGAALATAGASPSLFGMEQFEVDFKPKSYKNEQDGATHHKRNEDHFKKLDRDRTEKKCEYAVLVSLLEPESELYNGGIVDVSYRFQVRATTRARHIRISSRCGRGRAS